MDFNRSRGIASSLSYFHDLGSEMLRDTVQFPLKADRLEAILYPTSHLIKGSIRFDDRFETAHPSPNRS
jgi:hypothetical protein